MKTVSGSVTVEEELRKCIKINYLCSNCIIFIFFSSFSFSADDISTPSKYQVTMSKLELCTSSDCSDATVLTNTSASFNIASASAGADVGSWINSFELEIGKHILI